MLATLMTALFFVVRAFGQVSLGWPWQQVGFIAFHFISRNLWVILLGKVASSGECELGMPQLLLQHSCGCAVSPCSSVQPSGSACPWQVAHSVGLGARVSFCHRSISRCISNFAEHSSLLCPCMQEASAGAWASQSDEQELRMCMLSLGVLWVGEEEQPSPV